MANWLSKYDNGGDVKKNNTPYNPLTDPKNKPTVYFTEDLRSYYDPVGNDIYYNPESNYLNPRKVLKHEGYHWAQNMFGDLQVPELYPGPLAKPSTATDPNNKQITDYYNRGGLDREFMLNSMVERNPNFIPDNLIVNSSPSMQFVPADILWNGVLTERDGLKKFIPGGDSYIYDIPGTVEGDAMQYENTTNMFPTNPNYEKSMMGVYGRHDFPDVEEKDKFTLYEDMAYKQGGLIKRADGSYSRRGLWDNIRANRGSGRKPTPEMLRQERKIKKHADGSEVTNEPTPCDVGYYWDGKNCVPLGGKPIMNINDFFMPKSELTYQTYDENTGEQFIDYYDHDNQNPYAARLEECEGGGRECLEQANYYYDHFMAPILGTPNSWQLKQNAGITSGATNPRFKDYESSADSWDMHALFQETGATKVLAADIDNPYSIEDQLDKMTLDEQKDYFRKLNLPLGTYIGMGYAGGDGGHYGNISYNKTKGLVGSNHSGILAGYDETGLPMIYDYGRLVPITERTFGRANFPITNITIPKETAQFTYDFINSDQFKPNPSQRRNNYATNFTQTDFVLSDKGNEYGKYVIRDQFEKDGYPFTKKLLIQNPQTNAVEQAYNSKSYIDITKAKNDLSIILSKWSDPLTKNEFMQTYNISSQEYDAAVKAMIGIYGAETKYGTDYVNLKEGNVDLSKYGLGKHNFKYPAPEWRWLVDTFYSKKKQENMSIGPFQVTYSQLSDKFKKENQSVDVTMLNDAVIASEAVMANLASGIPLLRKRANTTAETATEDNPYSQNITKENYLDYISYLHNMRPWLKGDAYTLKEYGSILGGESAYKKLVDSYANTVIDVMPSSISTTDDLEVSADRKKKDGSWVTNSSIPRPTTPSFYNAGADKTLTNYQMGTPKARMYAMGSSIGEDLPIDPRTGLPVKTLKEVEVIGYRNPVDSTKVRESTYVDIPKFTDKLIDLNNIYDKYGFITPDYNVAYANKLLKDFNVKVDSTGNILKDIGLPSGAYYNPITRTIHYNSNTTDSTTAKRKFARKVIEEIPHAIQADKMGVIPFLVNIGIDALSDPTTHRYHTKGTLENEAHHIIAPRLETNLYNKSIKESSSVNLPTSTKKQNGGPVMYAAGGTIDCPCPPSCNCNSIPTAADSLILYNNALDKINFYRNNPDYQKIQTNTDYDYRKKSVRKDLIKQASQLNNTDTKVNASIIDRMKQFAEGEGKPLTKDELKKIQNKLNELRFGKVPGANLTMFADLIGPRIDPYMYNPLAPPIYLHPDIAPQGTEAYRSDRFGDLTYIPYYDPLAVKPEYLRTKEEKEEWNKKYGKPPVPPINIKPIISKDDYDGLDLLPKEETKAVQNDPIFMEGYDDIPPVTLPSIRMELNPKFDNRVDKLPNRKKEAVVDALGNPRYKYWYNDGKEERVIGELEYNKLKLQGYAQGGPVMYNAGSTVWTNQDTPTWIAGTPTPTATQNFRNTGSLNTNRYRIGDVIPTGMGYKTPAAGTHDYNQDVQPYHTMRLHAPDTTRMGDGSYVDRFNTKLKGKELEAFNYHSNLFKNLLNDTYDYDTRGFYNEVYNKYNGDLEAITQALTPGSSTQHIGTDRFKKPNHPTFSNESKYSIPIIRPGGKWGHDEEGDYDYFVAKRRNIKNMNASDGSPLNYFKRAEDYNQDGTPDVKLFYKGAPMFKRGSYVNSPRVYGSPVNPSGMSEGPISQRGMMFGNGSTVGNEDKIIGTRGPNDNIKVEVDPATGMPITTLKGVEVVADRPDTYNNYITNKYKNAGLAASMFGMPLDYVFGFPQAAMTKAFTGKYQTPSEAMDIQNPVGAFATDMILDPANLLGLGILSKEGILAKLARNKRNINLPVPSSGNSFISNFLSTTSEKLAQANRDAVTFSNSAANRTKLEQFRPNSRFVVTNQQARYIDDPEAIKLYDKYAADNNMPETIDQYLNGRNGMYGARDYGDLNDVTLVNRNSATTYTDAAHETTHSRSIRLRATPEEKRIAAEAWKPMLDAHTFGLPEEEAFAVQNELRLHKLKDMKGERIYTDADIPEIRRALEAMKAEPHPYLQGINIDNFNMPALINSLNKIGLGSLTIGAGLYNYNTTRKNYVEKQANGGYVQNNNSNAWLEQYN
jgi:hypothetical protein